MARSRFGAICLSRDWPFWRMPESRALKCAPSALPKPGAFCMHRLISAASPPASSHCYTACSANALARRRACLICMDCPVYSGKLKNTLTQARLHFCNRLGGRFSRLGSPFLQQLEHIAARLLELLAARPDWRQRLLQTSLQTGFDDGIRQSAAYILSLQFGQSSDIRVKSV